MARATALWVCLFGTLWLAACATAPALPTPADAGSPTRTIRIVSNGWHTAIVVARGELTATGLVPEADDFPGAVFLEFGWGDRVYYPAREKTLAMALDAVLTETPAVMHLAGLDRPPEAAYAAAEVVPVALSGAAFRNLITAIAAEFERPAGARAPPLARGLYPTSNFYKARGSFHLFNTCNTWTARMLRAGGLNLSPSGVVTADELMVRLRAALQ